FKCTPEGIIFHERSKAVLGAVEQAVAEVSNDEQAMKGAIRIAAPHCFGETLLPEGVKRIRESFPRIDIELVLNDKVTDLVTEGVDISFRLGQLGDGAYIAWPLGDIERVLVASPDYLSRSDAIDDLEDLSRHNLIRVKGAFDVDLLPLCRDGELIDTVPVQTIIKTTHWRPMYELVLAGLGLGVLEAPAVKDALATGELVRVLPQYEVPALALNLLIQPQRPIALRVRKVVDTLRSYISEALSQ
ncbi:MAG: substrate binding domain-containing protein, partial [Paraburkholderia tropica]